VVSPRFHFVSVVAHVGAANPTFGWRLLGPNHRELGRGSTLAASLDEAAQRAEWLSRHVHSMNTSHRRIDVSPGGWVWHLEDETGPVAHSSRTYAREREALYCLRAFATAAPHADIRLPERQSRLPQVRASAFLAHAGGAVAR